MLCLVPGIIGAETEQCRNFWIGQLKEPFDNDLQYQVGGKFEMPRLEQNKTRMRKSDFQTGMELWSHSKIGYRIPRKIKSSERISRAVSKTFPFPIPSQCANGGVWGDRAFKCFFNIFPLIHPFVLFFFLFSASSQRQRSFFFQRREEVREDSGIGVEGSEKGGKSDLFLICSMFITAAHSSWLLFSISVFFSSGKTRKREKTKERSDLCLTFRHTFNTVLNYLIRAWRRKWQRNKCLAVNQSFWKSFEGKVNIKL